MDEKYQRIKVLGKGSFGKAYLVKNTEADELCVVKQMETSTMDPKERNEAVKEAMLLKRMDHPNIVRFKEVFITRKGRLCIVMDYADGGDVHQAIKRCEGKLLPELQIIEWFVQSCFALKHVHERKVLHRDLKTQNIFLMATGQIKLGDFGIARVLDATKDYAKTMVGTPYYLSPEIIEDKPYNFKSDVWSLGVVLYEMTTLKHPFDADSLVILASKILKDQYPLPDAMYSDNLQALIKSMLCKDAQMRPFIPKILSNSFLQESMHNTNSRYNLGLDLSDFSSPSDTSAASKPSLAERRRQEVTAAAAQQPPPGDEALSSRPPALAPEPQAPAVYPASHAADAHGDGDSVLMGTVAPSAALAAANSEACLQEKASPAPAPQVEAEAEESEYEEEFEDYSGSEDGEKNPASELRQSVANLKLDDHSGGAASSAPAAEAEATTSKIGAKAESLRSYLRGQMPEADFMKAYELVKASGEVSAEEVKESVVDVLGADRAPELLTLFQLLCFLENVSAEQNAS